jgi:hypothetical protein
MRPDSPVSDGAPTWLLEPGSSRPSPIGPRMPPGPVATRKSGSVALTALSSSTVLAQSTRCAFTAPGGPTGSDLARMSSPSSAPISLNRRLPSAWPARRSAGACWASTLARRLRMENTFGMCLCEAFLLCGFFFFRHDGLAEMRLSCRHATSQGQVDTDIAHRHFGPGERAEYH